MCGIVGAVSRKLDLWRFEAALRSLGHRGPDQSGIVHEGDVWLGHTRLAINDLSQEAAQPFDDPVSKCVVLFNGEIYNYRTLREKLGGRVDFRTDCEAEVLARLYLKHGEDMVQMLDGMFAFVIFDRSRRRLFGARDRFGKKPFFYFLSEATQELYFSSELKAFKHLPVDCTLDTRILDNVLNFTFYHGESILQGIHSLPSGGYVNIDLEPFCFRQGLYFDVGEMVDVDRYRHWHKVGIGAASDELSSLLGRAVDKRLISDVPVAVISSGGLDSSLLSTLANRNTRYNLLHIDSVDNSELDNARLLSEKLDVDLITDSLDYDRFCEMMEEAIFYWEFPLVHPNATGILQVAKLARREGYKVILGGEGADELFGGYPHHRQFRSATVISRIMSWVPTAFAQALIYAREFNKGGSLDPTIQHIQNRHTFVSFYNRYWFVKSEYERQMLAFIATDLMDYLVPLLSRADRMTMASGVEMRLPFLDQEVVRFALNLPLNYKLGLRHQKKLLKLAAKNNIPQFKPDTNKTGFTIDYARRYVDENVSENFPFLDNYMHSKIVLEGLRKRGQYHKILRFYSLDKICQQLL